MSTAADVSIRSDGNQQHLQTVNDPNDIEEDFDDMMDQLLERDGPAVGGGESGGSGASAPVAAAAIVAHIIATDDSMAEDVDDTQHDSQMLTQDESRFESGDVGVGADGGDGADNQSDAEGSGSQADGTDEEDEVDDDATTEENDDDEVAMDDDGDEGK